MQSRAATPLIAAELTRRPAGVDAPEALGGREGSPGLHLRQKPPVARRDCTSVGRPHGTFGELGRRATAGSAGGEDLVFVFIPSLAALLTHCERTAGAPLGEAEVCSIRDNAVGMLMQRAEAEAMAQSRGYADLDPHNCWAEWQELRNSSMGGFP